MPRNAEELEAERKAWEAKENAMLDAFSATFSTAAGFLVLANLRAKAQELYGAPGDKSGDAAMMILHIQEMMDRARAR